MHRLLKMQSAQIVKSVFDSLHKLNNQGFHTWVSKAYELSQLYGIDIDSCSELPSDQFKQICNERLKNCFITSWLHDLHSCNTSIIRTYRSYKLDFGMECYLKHVNNSKFRVALSKLRTSSHSLEIEWGRYTRPKLNVDQRLCMSCNVVEDEEHFVLHCQDNRMERELLFQKIYMRDISFFNLSSSEQFVFLMRCSDPHIMAWFGKFIHHSFLNRNILRYNARTRWGQWVVFYGLFVTGGNVWWHAVPSVKEGAAVSSWSFVLKCMCLSVCVPICCWLNFMWIICSIILNISWFYSSYHLYFLCFSAVLQYFYMFACHFIMVCFICLYMFLSICLYIVSDDEIKMINLISKLTVFSLRHFFHAFKTPLHNQSQPTVPVACL